MRPTAIVPSLFLDVDEERAALSQIRAFMTHAGTVSGRKFVQYRDLHRWSCDHVAEFWSTFVRWANIKCSGDLAPALVDGDSVRHARFFPALRLNFTRNLLGQVPGVADSSAALAWCSENGATDQLDRGSLRRRVLTLAKAMREAGVDPGDRIVAVVRNGPDAIIACLATAALGATWSSVAPDLANHAIVRRFAQLQPKVLVADLEYVYQGRRVTLGERIPDLLKYLPSIRLAILTRGEPPAAVRAQLPVLILERLERGPALEIDELENFPFDHPLYIVFTSGTTGLPKCIVHGAGGTLLEQLKEHILQGDMRASDRMFFITSCGWMMWNWQLAVLALGASLFVYDGSVAFPDRSALLRTVDQQEVTVFGFSPAYVQFLRQSNIVPRRVGLFRHLRLLLSTGSILYPEHYDWLREYFGALPVHSISGGTEIMGAFVGGNPITPIYRGESPAISLGLDVRVATGADGIKHMGIGELVCVKPFPSRPTGIWDDRDGSKFHSCYFAQHENVWTHGDAIEITDRNTVRIIGRSDAVLTVAGVRIGPSEIYEVVLAIPGVCEAMVVPRNDPAELGGIAIILLLVLDKGTVLNQGLRSAIKQTLLAKASRLHVPRVILQVTALPRTLNGKYSERAARDVINGRQPANYEALANPECLAELESAFKESEELRTQP